MQLFLKILLVTFFCSFLSEIKAQSDPESDVSNDSVSDIVLLKKQWSLGAQLNTNGWGLKFRRGHNLTNLKQFFWEIEFTTYKSVKEIRAINPYYSDSKSYFYGKLNYLYFLKGGFGIQRVLNRKPYWGGVQLSYIYYGGISVGIAKPVHLYIIHYTDPQSYVYEIDEEKYDPGSHFPDNIYGRASFLSGFENIKFYPGIYARGGLEFEFGTKQRRIKSLEAGALIEFSPIPIPVMAYNPRQQLFLTLYFSFSFGKRYNYRGEN